MGSELVNATCVDQNLGPGGNPPPPASGGWALKNAHPGSYARGKKDLQTTGDSLTLVKSRDVKKSGKTTKVLDAVEETTAAQEAQSSQPSASFHRQADKP